MNTGKVAVRLRLRLRARESVAWGSNATVRLTKGD